MAAAEPPASRPDRDGPGQGGPVALRPIGPEDEEFLVTVYGSTRTAELALVDWDDPQKAAFVRQQFEAQHRYYQQYFAGAAFRVILVDGTAAGRLYVDEAPGETKVIDITLLPAFQGRGIGTALLTDVLARSGRREACVTIHVERSNAARRLYERLGFEVVEEGPVYSLLRWMPPGPSGSGGGPGLGAGGAAP